MSGVKKAFVGFLLVASIELRLQEGPPKRYSLTPRMSFSVFSSLGLCKAPWTLFFLDQREYGGSVKGEGAAPFK